MGKRILFILAICILAVGLGIGYYLVISNNKISPIKPIIKNNTFTLSSVKLNKRIISNTDGTLPNTQNVTGATSIGQAGNFRRSASDDESGTMLIKSNGSTYEIQENSSWFNKTVLLKNKKEIWSKMLVFTTFDPIRSFFTAENTVVLAYDHFPRDSQREQDVVINGQSMNERYTLTASFAAYKFDVGVLFFAQKGERYYVVINEKFFQLPSTIKEIIDPPCCEPAIYAVAADNSSIIFYSENKDNFWYQNKISLRNNNVNFLNTLNWTLPFGEKIVSFSRMGSGKVENSFWQEVPVSKVLGNVTIDTLTLFANNNVSDLVYDASKGTYYYLNPGGYDQLALVSQAEYKQKVKEQATQSDFNTDSGTAIINVTEPYKLSYTGGPTQWMAIKRSTYHVFEKNDPKDKNNWLSDGYKIDCYIPIEGGTFYVEYSTQVTSTGSEINNCDMLSNMGIQSAAFVKLTPEKAVELVKTQQEVIDYMKRVPGAHVAVDHENENSFTVHVFEINSSQMTATFNWYEVEKQSAAIKKMFDVK